MKQRKDSYLLSSFRERFLLSFYLFFGIVLTGTIGYKIIGGSETTLLDSLYMTVITLSTVGYGEIVDLTAHPYGRVFTLLLIIFGMGVLLYVVSNITAFIVEGELLEIFWRRKMDKLINGMNGHHILCGAGRIGFHIIQEFYNTNRDLVVIDIDENIVEDVRKEFPEVPVLQADGIENDFLLEAGICRASGVLVATGSDKDNMVITMTARQINPKLRIVARCNDMKNFEKLNNAGADSVVSSNLIGGLRMASEMVRPTVVSFLDVMLRDREKNLRVEEVFIPEASRLEGKTIGDAGVRNVAGSLLMAVRQVSGGWEYNPADSFKLQAGMSLIIMGSPEVKKQVEEFVA